MHPTLRKCKNERHPPCTTAKKRNHPTLDQMAPFTNHKAQQRTNLNHATHIMHYIKKKTKHNRITKITNGSPKKTIYKQTKANNVQTKENTHAFTWTNKIMTRNQKHQQTITEKKIRRREISRCDATHDNQKYIPSNTARFHSNLHRLYIHMYVYIYIYTSKYVCVILIFIFENADDAFNPAPPRPRPWGAQILCPEFFRDAAAQPKPPTHISQRFDGRISKTIVKMQSKKPKRDEHTRKLCSPNCCFEAPAENSITYR